LATDATTAFFSYSREDSQFVLRLAEDLKTAGANVWLDQLDITPGQRWARSVQDALTNCPRVLVVLSPASAESPNVQDEVTFALEEKKNVILFFIVTPGYRLFTLDIGGQCFSFRLRANQMER
jgi:TIR domain